MPRLSKRAISIRECEALAEHQVKLSHIEMSGLTKESSIITSSLYAILT